jgi:hypothetical protein
MFAANLTEPNSSLWFGFGSIFEQFGEDDAAIAAYHRVTLPDGALNPVDTYNLAQARLKKLRPDGTQ